MKYLLLSFIALTFSFKTNQPEISTPTARPKNIILLIGDGMGLSQISAGYYANGKKLNFEKFPITGLMTTHSASHLITDSAAGATAFSCGCKTNNGVLGETAKKKRCVTILEDAEKQGLATGLVASCSITHATPAAFIAHVDSRAESEIIATYFLETDIDLMIGGGLKFFNERKLDSRNLYAELATKGYQVSNFAEKKLQELTFLPTQPFAWFCAREEPSSVANGRDWLPYAAGMAPIFLQKRSNKGFFLMLEGSQIDWACHANEGERAVQEMLDFDAAVGEILAFAQADGETLVIITADHETGGFAVMPGSKLNDIQVAFTTKSHTAMMIPVFAEGPGAEAFRGIYENTAIFDKFKSAMDLK